MLSTHFNELKLMNVNMQKSSFLSRLLMLALVIFSNSLAAQSRDPDKPTLIESKTIGGESNSGLNSETDYYYSFYVEPGILKLTLDIKPMSKTDAGGYFEWAIMDTNFVTLKGDVFTAQGSAGRQVVDINVTKKRQIILKTVVSGAMSYQLKLDGPVKFVVSKSSKR